MTDTKHLQTLQRRADKAAAKVRGEMMRIWPIGTTVRAQLQKNHQGTTECVVLSHEVTRHGHVLVRMPSGFENTIHYRRIVG